MIRVALGQVCPKLGDVRANTKQHLAYIDAAKKEAADVVVFPELGLTGYMLKDLTFDVARPIGHPDIAEVTAASKDIDVVFSFVEEDASHRFYISSVYAHAGKVSHVHRKVYLPTYGLFEEARHLARGVDIDAITIGDHRVGMMICEDAWHPSVPYLLSVAGVDVMFVPAAGPGRALSGDPHSGSQMFWERMLRTYAQLFTCYIVFVNRVGFEDGIFFFGHSLVVGPNGEVLGGAPSHHETLATVDLDLSLLRKERYRTPLLRDEDAHLTERVLAKLMHRGGRALS